MIYPFALQIKWAINRFNCHSQLNWLLGGKNFKNLASTVNFEALLRQGTVYEWPENYYLPIQRIELTSKEQQNDKEANHSCF